MGDLASNTIVVLQGDLREHLLRSLRGCSFVMPDFRQTFAHWPQDVNPEVDRLSEEVEKRLEQFFPTGKIARKMREAKVAEFGASWWPYASFDRLCIATYLSLWLFAWDDETDSSEISDIVNHNDRAALFRHQTKTFIHASLSGQQLAQPGQGNPFIANFGDVGRAIAESCTPDQRQRFIEELDYFLEMTDLEQRIQSSNKLPTVQEYSRRRMGSSAVGVCLAITEYAYGMELPPSMMNEEPIRRLWELTNIIISITNDVMSVKKEISHGQTDSLIPLLYAQQGTLQGAVDAAALTVSSCVVEFDQLSQLITTLSPPDKTDIASQVNIQKFIDGCRYACTANLNWGLHSERYKLCFQSLELGLSVTLK